ncbi:MAG: hypothetical protein ACLQVI_30210 [Polyangiaceae bacterium]
MKPVPRVFLSTPPVPRIVPDGVFDAFGWCESDRLEWGRTEGPFDLETPVTSANPPGMVFVLQEGPAAAFLPRELAGLHVKGMGFTGEWALAPWGIDDATDLLYEHRVPPGELLWLATGSLAGLFWGLHDWAHFHNHGAFEPHQRAWTEVQCDAAALVWAWVNREAIGVDERTWERARREVVAVGRGRFESEGGTFDDTLLGAEPLKGLLRC